MVLNTHDVASALGTDDHTARRFLRSIVPDHDPNTPWRIPEEELTKIKLLFLVHRLGPVKSLDLIEENLKST